MAKQSLDARLGPQPVWPRSPEPTSTPSSLRSGAAETSPQAPTGDSWTAKRPEQVEAGTLIVGRGISFTGEITACDRLIVDGIVEASLQHCRDMLVNDSGHFKGEAVAENAEVSGRTEGSLVVKKRLLIRATGQISGSTIYGQIEVERGGRISGRAEARNGVQEQ